MLLDGTPVRKNRYFRLMYGTSLAEEYSGTPNESQLEVGVEVVNGRLRPCQQL